MLVTTAIRATTRNTKTATATRRRTRAKATTASVITARVKAGTVQVRARGRGRDTRTKTRSKRAWSEALQIWLPAWQKQIGWVLKNRGLQAPAFQGGVAGSEVKPAHQLIEEITNGPLPGLVVLGVSHQTDSGPLAQDYDSIVGHPAQPSQTSDENDRTARVGVSLVRSLMEWSLPTVTSC